MANALNPNIILAAQSPDIVGIMGRANQAGQQAREFQQQNALTGYLQQNGAAVMGGDQNALNGLANFGVQGLDAAQTVQGNRLSMDQTRLGMEKTRLGMDATRQNMSLAQSQEARLTREEKRAISEHAASLTAQQRDAEAAQIEQTVAVAMAAQGDEQWNAAVEQVAPDLVGQFENREMIAAKYMTIAEVMKRQDEMNAPAGSDEPASFTALRMRAEQAGLQPGSPEYQQFMVDGGSKSGMRITTNPDGTMSVETGGAVGTGGTVSPSSPGAMLSTIDGILADPALDTSTGLLAPLQAIPGTPQRRFAGRANQLEGQAFLQAFESLKGAGQITEIEGQKATQAIGRLDTAQSPDDYRQALGELRDVLETAVKRGGQSGMDFSSMGRSDMLSVDMSDWSIPDFEAYSRRMDELGL